VHLARRSREAAEADHDHEHVEVGGVHAAELTL
jgi:hypothetical protein